MNACSSLLRRLRRDERAVAMIEFAYALPIFVALSVGGVELSHYITTKMRVSQIALHIADHAARIGAGTQLAQKTVTETQINDLFVGSGLQANELKLFEKGRVILSSLEPVANPNPTNRFKIGWQRCRGMKVHNSTYGASGDTNLTGIGPAARQVRAPADGATMFVEVSYTYKPIIATRYAPSLQITEIASFPVRDRRDTSQVYNTEGAPRALCTTFGS